VYDVSPKVPGVFIEADVLEVETENSQLKVTERFFVHTPARRDDAVEARSRSRWCCRPSGGGRRGRGSGRTGCRPASSSIPTGPKGHYAFNFPIQPDDGDKDTLSSSRITFRMTARSSRSMRR